MREQGEVTPVGRIVSESIDYDNKYFPVIKRVVETPDFVTREPQYLLDRSGKTFAASVVLTESGNILFVNEPKYGQMNYFLAVPTGAVKNGETPEQAAQRETLEETGYQAKNFTVINSKVVSMADKVDGGEHIILVADHAQKVQEPEQSRQAIELSKEQVEKLLDKELEGLQLEIDISRLALFEALRFLDRLDYKIKTRNVEVSEKTYRLAQKLKQAISQVPKDTNTQDLYFRGPRKNKNKNLVDWYSFMQSLPNSERASVTRSLFSLFRLEENRYKTIGEVRIPSLEVLLNTNNIGVKIANFLKATFPGNSVFDAEDQTQ